MQMINCLFCIFQETCAISVGKKNEVLGLWTNVVHYKRCKKGLLVQRSCQLNKVSVDKNWFLRKPRMHLSLLVHVLLCCYNCLKFWKHFLLSIPCLKNPHCFLLLLFFLPSLILLFSNDMMPCGFWINHFLLRSLLWFFFPLFPKR